jgi:hypothetical protein
LKNVPWVILVSHYQMVKKYVKIVQMNVRSVFFKQQIAQNAVNYLKVLIKNYNLLISNHTNILAYNYVRKVILPILKILIIFVNHVQIYVKRVLVMMNLFKIPKNIVYLVKMVYFYNKTNV